jgi:hypothetical protein
MRFVFMLFLFITVSVLFLANYFVYFSIVRFFVITSLNIKKILGGSLFFLITSFILSSIAAHFFDNLITKIYYYFSSCWAAVLIYLLIGFSIAWLIIFIAKTVSLNINLPILGSLVIILSLAYSIYGIFNANDIKFKYIEVPIKNLPSAWNGKTAVQISDVHVGIINGRDFVENIVNKINTIKPEIVFITGDYFDGMRSRTDHFVEPLKNLNPPQGTYFVNGNHEVYFGIDKVDKIFSTTKVKTLYDQMVEIDGLQIVGASFTSDLSRNDMGKVLKLFDKAKPSILLYHAPMNIEEIKNSGINLQLSGHTHVGQLFPFHFITQLIFRGYDYGLHTIGDYNLYTTSGTGTWGPPIRTGNSPEIVVIKLIDKK